MPLGPSVESLSSDPSRRAGIDGRVERLKMAGSCFVAK
jgi:hypothetical protein